MSFNKPCKTTNDLELVLILKPQPSQVIVHFKLNLSVKTLAKSSTSAFV
jgi:hypothetical protein